jgi:formylmethanofuran dehydrogenase subunit C
MITTTLRVAYSGSLRVDGSTLTPAALAALPVARIERMLLTVGKESMALAELFTVTQQDDPRNPGESAALVIEGDARRVDRIGTGSTEGTLLVHGGVGDYVGFQMSGGRIDIDGDAGDFCASGMRAGRLTVRGSVGDFAAAALPGDMEGMSGGALTVHRHAGARLADRMRRGLVLVGGDAGEFAASRLVAGTVGIAGTVGQYPGYAMRRGTLLLLRAPSRLAPTFTEGGSGFDVFWRLLTRSLAHELAPFAALQGHAALPQRLTGDLAVDGRGEMLLPR